MSGRGGVLSNRRFQMTTLDVRHELTELKKTIPLHIGLSRIGSIGNPSVKEMYLSSAKRRHPEYRNLPQSYCGARCRGRAQ